MKPKKKPAAAVDVSQLIPLTEAARLADVSDTWLRQLFKDGKIVGVRIGRHYYITLESAQSFSRHPYLGRPRGVAKSADGPVKKAPKPRGKKP
jgi:hypothetical protein